VALDEVRRREAPSPPPPHERAQVVDRQGRGPQRELGRPIEEGGDQQQRRSDHGAGREAEDGGAQLWIVAAGDRIQDDVERADEEVRDAEDERFGTERRRRR
jgi:hypothetical protein